jgi:hypothetical protein
MPEKKIEWKDVARGCNSVRTFPHSVVITDEKHIQIMQPSHNKVFTLTTNKY